MNDQLTAWRAEGSGWELDRVHFDRPPTAFTASLYLDPVTECSAAGFAEWSLPVERYRFRLVNGWAYGRIEPFGGEPPAIVEKVPVLANLWRIDPRARKRIKGFDRFVTEGGFENGIDRWEEDWRPEAERRVAPLKEFDPETASDGELAANLEACQEYLRWAWSFHLNIHLTCFYVRARFRDACRDLLDLTDFEAYELIKRTDPVLLEGTAKLAAIAQRAQDDKEVVDALELPADQALDRLKGTWFDDELRSFLDAEGFRSGSFELSDPTWREMPELVVATVKSFGGSPYDPVAEEQEFDEWRRSRVDELRGRLEGAARAEFDRWLALGERAYPLNETHNRLLVEMPWAYARYTALEAARRMRKADRLARESDVFHLSADELVLALRGDGGDIGDIKATASGRAQDYERALKLSPPPAVGPPAPEPPYHALPPAVSAAMRALIEQTGEMLGKAAPAHGEDRLVGSPGSPGTAEGPVRIVHSLASFDTVQPGDVLVCPLTNPSWTVLFPRIAALVTDSGGALSHAAIVAREYGVPSVVGTVDATRRLHDGQRVAVDGGSGTIEILSPAPESVA